MAVTVAEVIRDHLSLEAIDSVTFFKRDEFTTDLICCHIEAGDRRWSFHEDMEGWESLIQHLEKLPGFRSDWFSAVAHPAFETCETVAFKRA